MADESEESVFWSEKEDGYGDIFTYNHHHHQSIVHEESNSKRVRISPELDHQEGDEESCEQSSPLGLTLRKTPSFLSLVQRSLSKGWYADLQARDNQSDKPTTKKDDFGSEKLKASNFPVTFIKIGAWQRSTRHEGDLTAKLYYAKRKLVWEVLDGALKSKIEIQWSDIIAMRAITAPDNEPGTLEIELNQPPLFYREINPQPRKHTLWQQASDFTGGQAPIWRRHYVRFPPGILDKHYEKLLQCDDRLFDLSHKPFPSHESPYFDPTMFGISELSLGFTTYRSTYRAPHRLVPHSTLPVMELPLRHEGGSNNQFETRTTQTTPWGQEPVYHVGNVNINQGPPFNISSSTQGNQVFHSHNYQPNIGLLDDIENHLLGEHRVEGTLSMNVNANYNANCSGSSDDQVMQYEQYINPVLDGVYSEDRNWMFPQKTDDTVVMEQTMNLSLSPFLYPDHNPTNQDFS